MRSMPAAKFTHCSLSKLSSNLCGLQPSAVTAMEPKAEEAVWSERLDCVAALAMTDFVIPNAVRCMYHRYPRLAILSLRWSRRRKKQSGLKDKIASLRSR